MNLIRKSIYSSFWVLLDIIFNRAIYFIATLILARLLGPNEFGLIGLIIVFVSIGNNLIESGLSVSLVRTPNPNNLDYNTLFYINLGMGLCAYLLIYTISPFIANFYNQPILENLIRIYCISFIISPIRMIPNAILIREMEFKKITLLNIPGNLLGLSLGIWMALNGYKVWSIVGLNLFTQFITSFTYWFYSSWRPSLVFSMEKMKYHWSFGYKLMFSAQLNTIFDNIYNFLIGKFYSVRYLGFYERAYTLNNYPITIISSIVSKVTLPLFSKVIDEKDKLKSVYKEVMLFSFYVTCPLMLGALVLAEPIFGFLLGSKWNYAVPFFQILCIANIFYPIHSLNVNILSVYGRSDLFLKLELIKKILTIFFIAICFNFGMYGLVWSAVLGSISSLFINSFYTGKFLGYHTKNQLLDLFPILIVSILMTVLIFFIRINLLITYSYISQLLLLSILGLTTFLGLSILFKIESLYDLIKLLKRTYPKFVLFRF